MPVRPWLGQERHKRCRASDASVGRNEEAYSRVRTSGHAPLGGELGGHPRREERDGSARGAARSRDQGSLKGTSMNVCCSKASHETVECAF